ncbi:UNVERIFIED_CONTAM: hypothetical protein GTU68_034301 [Idotea baltica]|nr:hypothetical protein [Idotea baltica]
MNQQLHLASKKYSTSSRMSIPPKRSLPSYL